MSSIRADSQLIMGYFISKVIELNSLENSFKLNYDTIAKECHLMSADYCKICCQYLADKRFIKCVYDENDNAFIYVTANGIDFAETSLY